jgi:hypothetical protein
MKLQECSNKSKEEDCCENKKECIMVESKEELN